MPQSITSRASANQPLRVLGITAIGAAAALTLSSCAGSSVPALDEVWPDVTASIEDAASVAVDGIVSEGGAEVTVALSGQIDDSSYSGEVSMDGADIQVVGNTEYTYMKPNAAFYEQLSGAQLQEIVGDKWLETPAEQSGLTMSSYWETFIGELPEAESFGNSDYPSEAVELDGEEVYKYTGMATDSGEPISVHISKDNKLVRLEIESGGSASGIPTAEATPSESPSASSGNTGVSTVSFSQWDSVEPVDMPAEDEIFSVPEM